MDYSKAVEIAPNIYWVGYIIPDDPFQCHVYLIKNGNESILIDPGSMIAFPVVLEKITSILPLRDIKYIIMHHQDPDIVGCFSTLEKLFPKGERFIVTHWRTEMLLKHYQWETPFYLVDTNNWKLKAGNRELEFIFTPYAHFPGAFCTYDKESKILFSSDLFGGLTPEFELFAKSTDEYFEYLKPFHEHYIPNKEILNYVLYHIEKKDISLIAPQHGSIIKKEIISPLIEKMKDLDCGLYLMDDYVSDIKILSMAENIYKQVIKSILSDISFDLLIKNLYSHIKNYLPQLIKIKVCGESIFLDKEVCFEDTNDIEEGTQCFVIKEDLYNENDKFTGKLYLYMKDKLSPFENTFLNMLLKHLKTPLSTSLEKEIILLNFKRKSKFYEQKAITDTLTELYNREFMKEYLNKKTKEAKRYHFPLSLAMIDIDFFKKINDTYGHLIGDCVLKELAEIMNKFFRGSDISIRYGGEEFVIILPFADIQNAYKIMEAFRKEVENYKFCGKRALKITVSIGICEMKEETNFEELIKKADDKLYEAKANGRNRVIC